jgi:hypothetical protein
MKEADSSDKNQYRQWNMKSSSVSIGGWLEAISSPSRQSSTESKSQFSAFPSEVPTFFSRLVCIFWSPRGDGAPLILLVIRPRMGITNTMATHNRHLASFIVRALMIEPSALQNFRIDARGLLLVSYFSHFLGIEEWSKVCIKIYGKFREIFVCSLQLASSKC